MRKRVKSVALVLGGILLGGTVLHQPLAWAATNVPRVFVANDAANPVPVREQNLDANGNIKTHEQGTARVSDVNDPAQNAVVAQVFDQVEAHTGELSGTEWYAVPAGKRLVIQYVSGGCTEAITHATLVTHQPDSSLWSWPLRLSSSKITQELTVYVEGGRTVRLAINNPSDGFASCTVQFAGYLIPSA